MTKKMQYLAPANGVDTHAPLIYMWEIANASAVVVGRYIGKANGGDKRPRLHYSRNVNKLLRGEPYRNDRPYRRVHIALANAVDAGHAISLHYLCNVPEEADIFAIEADYIRLYRCDAADGIGLNGCGALDVTRLGGGLPSLALTAPPLAVSHTVAAHDDERPDLEEFVEVIEHHYPGHFRIEAGICRYSAFFGKHRLLRAKQAKAGSKVLLKMPGTEAAKEIAWDGSAGQIIDMMEVRLSALSSPPATHRNG